MYFIFFFFFESGLTYIFTFLLLWLDSLLSVGMTNTIVISSIFEFIINCQGKHVAVGRFPIPDQLYA